MFPLYKPRRYRYVIIPIDDVNTVYLLARVRSRGMRAIFLLTSNIFSVILLVYLWALLKRRRASRNDFNCRSSQQQEKLLVLAVSVYRAPEAGLVKDLF